MRSQSAFVTILFLVFSVNAYAVQLSLPEISAAPGYTISVELSIDNATGIAGGDIDFLYDPTILAAKEVKATDLLAGMLWVEDLDVEGMVRLVMASLTGLPGGSGPMFQIIFEVKPGATGESPLTFTVALLYDEEGGDISVTTIDGIVRVKAPTNFDYDLKLGWNLISLPLQPRDTDPSVILSSLGTKYNSVWAYDPETGWSIYAPGAPSDLQELVPGRGYWIKMDETATLNFEGVELESTAVFLWGGKWNSVGYSSLETKDVEHCNLPDCINSVWEYDPDTGWVIYAPSGPSDLETMKPGFGYWIKVREDHPEDCVWNVNPVSP